MEQRQSQSVILKRGLKRLCPKCGQTKLFEGWYKPKTECEVCGFQIKARAGDCWAFVYLTTAAMIGFVLVLMLIFFMPLVNSSNLVIAQISFLLLAAVLIVLTLPYRKGLALAVDYLLDEKFESNLPNNQKI